MLSDSTTVRPVSAPTLARVADELGSVVQIVAAPRGLDVRVKEAVIFDVTGPHALEPGDVVLGVGVRPADPEALDLVSVAGAAGVAAVVLKVSRDDSGSLGLDAAAQRAGTAVLGIPPETGWALVHTLLRTVLVGVGPTLPSGPEGVAVGDLFALANAVAAYVGGATTIEDPQFRVLAYSSLDHPIDEQRREAILTRDYAEARSIYDSGIARQLFTTDGAVEVEGRPGMARRMAIAIRAGSEVLGSIWVQEGQARLGPEAAEALAQAAQVAALHMIRHGVTEDLERRRRGEMLAALLDGRSDPEVVAAALGLETKGEFTVMAVELDVADDASLVLKRERALGLMSLYFKAYRRRTAAVALGNHVYVLMPSRGGQDRDQLVSLAHDVLSHVGKGIEAPLRIGIGSTVGDLREARASRDDADQVLRVLRVRGGPAVADIDEMRAHAILLELRDLATERPHLRFGKLQAIVEHDSRRRTSYVESLRAYLDARGDVVVAAERLDVHPNTLRYRIRRVGEISGLALDVPEERLIAELQLRFM